MPRCFRRFRKGSAWNKRHSQQKQQQQQHRLSSGRLSHWYGHGPRASPITVDQLHKYRRKGFGESAFPVAGSPPPGSPPSFDTEYRCRYEPPYRTAEEMNANRRHAAVPEDQLHVEGDAEFTVEYAERYRDGPRERNVAPRQGSHIGPFVCADQPAPEGMAARSEQHDQFVPHPDGRRSEQLRPGTGLRVDTVPMAGETEQSASYRQRLEPDPPPQQPPLDAAEGICTSVRFRYPSRPWPCNARQTLHTTPGKAKRFADCFRGTFTFGRVHRGVSQK